MNVLLLKSKMTLNEDTQEDLANALGITRNTLLSRFSKSSSFTQVEISKIRDRYNLEDNEIIDIFFPD